MSNPPLPPPLLTFHHPTPKPLLQSPNFLKELSSGGEAVGISQDIDLLYSQTYFKNNVYYVSVNNTEPAKLHYFPNSHYKWGYDFLSMHDNFKQEGNYRSNPDYIDWLGNLLKKNTDYLFIYSLHQTKDIVFSLEDNWAKENPKKFSLVFSNKTIHIYKIFR